MQKRRTILINPRLQCRIVFSFLSVAIVCMAIQSTLMLVASSQIGGALSQRPLDAGALFREMTWIYSGIGFLLLIPLSVGVGFLVTLRIAGPLYRLERHLETVCRGEPVSPCQLRDGDECQRLCELINQAVALPTRRAAAPGERTNIAAECPAEPSPYVEQS
ncbi:MAG: hypothetical protein AB7O52_14835 [Planctomycetota bacterium]